MAPSDGGFFPLAVAAGTFGCLSSVFGRLSVESDGPSLLRRGIECLLVVDSETADLGLLAGRAGCFALNGLCTALMWRYYLQALARTTSATANVVATGTNFLLTAVCGALLFAEQLHPLWFAGAALIAAGMALMVRAEAEAEAAAGTAAESAPAHVQAEGAEAKKQR
eukprot:EG_transcript_28450